MSSDLFYDPRDDAAQGWIERGASVVEMEAAAILQVAARRGVAAACVLAVTDVPAPGARAGRGRSSSSRSACGWATPATPRSARSR